MFFYKILLFTTLFPFIQTFYGSQILSFITSTDYTHTDLVEIGTLQAVAKFLEKKRVPWKPTEPAPGSLSGISDITARKLYDKYYGSEVSSHKFQLAMDDISKHNLLVDQNYADQAHWHFNGEKIREANEKLIYLRNTTLDILAATKPDYDAARVLIGQFFHIMHDFYSNTNWIEMSGGTAVYDVLGIPGKTLNGTAGPNVDTCQNCGSALMPCGLFGAVISGLNLLTSGYRPGQGNATKPQKDPVANTMGKCSHGGMFDSSANTSAATGGINKETVTLEYSPMFSYHDKAAELAIEHTKQFFVNPGYGILRYIGDDKLMNLLRLYAGNPVAFVIDTSSTDMLDGIKKFVQDVINNVTGSIITPTNYILVTVNTTSNKTMLQESQNATDIQTWLNALTLPTSGSCAEFAIEGLRRAVVAAGERAKIYVFSDSAPTNPGEIHFITSLATSKEVSINFLTESSCKHRKKRGLRSILMPSIQRQRWRRSEYNPPDSANVNKAYTVKFYKPKKNLLFQTSTLRKGEKSTMEVRVLDKRYISSVKEVQLIDQNDGVLTRYYPQTKKTVRGDEIYMMQVTIPAQDFRVRVVGDVNSTQEAKSTSKLYTPT